MVCSVRRGVLFALLAIFVKDAYFAPAPEDDKNIARGRVARDGEFPFQVALLAKTGGQVMQYCGGAILSESVIITAAHCAEEYQSNHLVRAGVNDWTSTAGQDRSIQKVVIHPNYLNRPTFDGKYDVALMKLSQPFKFNAKVGSINLNQRKLQPGTKCSIIGFGGQEPGSRVGRSILKTGTVTTRSQSDPQIIEIPVLTSDDTICGDILYVSRSIYEKINCDAKKLFLRQNKGDSGGPFVCNGVLAGINSFGQNHIQLRQKKCPPDVSQGFASVDYHYNWIKTNMP